MSTIIHAEPPTFQEVVKEQVWKDAMAKEYESIMKNDVWVVVPRPKGNSIVTLKWLYKNKHGVDGRIEKYKERFVARGFSQKEGEYYDEIFGHVAQYTTIRSIVALAPSQGWTLHQMDVKISFLHGILQGEVYVEQPKGFEVKGKKNQVWRLKKALYGLKQAPRAWYVRIDSHLVKLQFTRNNVDSNLYFKVVQRMPLILVLYVDDLFLTSSEPLMLKCKRDLTSKFEMKDIALMHCFLGLEVWQRLGEIFHSQGKYIPKLLERFGIVECKSLATPMEMNFKKLCGDVVGPDLANPSEYRQLIGALMFLLNTRSDICFAVNTLNQFMNEPLHSH